LTQNQEVGVSFLRPKWRAPADLLTDNKGNVDNDDAGLLGQLLAVQSRAFRSFERREDLPQFPVDLLRVHVNA